MEDNDIKPVHFKEEEKDVPELQTVIQFTCVGCIVVLAVPCVMIGAPIVTILIETVVEAVLKGH